MSDTPALWILEVLERVADAQDGLSAQEIADSTHASRATVYRRLEDLVDAGWLVAFDSPRRYRAGIRVSELGLRALSHNTVRMALLPNAMDLARVVARTCMISFYDRGDCVFTDSVETYGEKVVPLAKSLRFPAAATASGKIMLAYQREEELQRVARAGLPKLTPNTRTTPEEILAEVQAARARGYGISEAELTPDSGGVSVVVFGRDGSAVATLGVNSSRVTEDFLDRVLEPLRAFAAKTSMELGYHTPSTEVP